MTTATQLQDYRDSLAEYAKSMGVSLHEAFDTCFTPEWVWSECSAAREAAGPAPVAPEGMDVLAAFWLETPERDAAAKAKYDEIRALVCD
jgi:hypothetical protein